MGNSHVTVGCYPNLRSSANNRVNNMLFVTRRNRIHPCIPVAIIDEYHIQFLPRQQ